VSPGTVSSTDLVDRYRRIRSPDLLTWLAEVEATTDWVTRRKDGSFVLSDRGLFDVASLSRTVGSGVNGHGKSKTARPTD
jgi:hypothetical protein